MSAPTLTTSPTSGPDAEDLRSIGYRQELHRRLGDLLYGQKQYDGAIREYAAVVASHPIDKAGAEFHLAQAYLAAGQKEKAQESVLAALEAAPGYRPAQKMLLELSR